MKQARTTTPREPCADCCRKHLGQASALLQESLQGYPDHRWLAIGHVAEAEAEIQGLHPDIAQGLRDTRKAMESDAGVVPDFLAVIGEVSRREEDGASCACEGITDKTVAREIRAAMRLLKRNLGADYD